MFDLFKKIKIFLIEARTEFRHINWPSKTEAWRMTMIVIGVSLAVSLFLAFFDNIFVLALQKFIFSY